MVGWKFWRKAKEEEFDWDKPIEIPPVEDIWLVTCKECGQRGLQSIHGQCCTACANQKRLGEPENGRTNLTAGEHDR